MEQRLSVAHEAAFIVGSAVNYPTDLGPKQRAGAHDARLQGDVEGAFGQVFAAEVVGGSGESNHFRVCRHVLQLLRLIVSPRDNLVVAHDHCAHGDFIFEQGLPGLFQGLLHEVIVGINSEHIVVGGMDGTGAKMKNYFLS